MRKILLVFLFLIYAGVCFSQPAYRVIDEDGDELDINADGTISTSGGSWIKLHIIDSGAGTTEISSSCTAAINTWKWCEVNISGVSDASKDDITDIAIEFDDSFFVGQNPTIYFDFMAKWDSSDELSLTYNPIKDGVLSVISNPTASGSDMSLLTKTEYSDYFINYGSSSSNLIPIGDESANNFLILYLYE